jgi:signal transduction histidine kinase
MSDHELLKRIERYVHDLKNPLISARGFLEFIPMVGKLNAKQMQYYQRAHDANEYVYSMIVNMLALVWLDSAEPDPHEVTDLVDLLRDLIEIQEGAAVRRKITFEFVPPSERLYVVGEPRHVQHIFTNLLSNAVKYNRPDGRVVIRVSTENDQATIAVQDDGPGIPADQLESIFERYYRAPQALKARIEGNGLGLAVVKEIAARYGGQVRVESEVGKGSTFFVVLPLGQPGEQDFEDEPHLERDGTPPAAAAREEEALVVRERGDGVDDRVQETINRDLGDQDERAR